MLLLTFLCCFGPGSDVDHRDSTGRSPLAAACSKDEYDCVKLLIDNGADLKPYPFDSANNSPLHIAARQPGARCLGLLIDAEIDVNKMCDGVTPLFEAASVGSSFGCNLLLSKGTVFAWLDLVVWNRWLIQGGEGYTSIFYLSKEWPLPFNKLTNPSSQV